MPSKSKKQHKLMDIAAHLPDGYGAAPEKVGMKYAKADKAGEKLQKNKKKRIT